MSHRASAPAVRATAVLFAAVLVTGTATPALAGAEEPVLGTVSVTPDRGSVSASPMLTAATTSVGCPTGYGTNVLLRVGAPGGPYNNIVKPAAAGGYDRGPVTLPADRSMTAALGRTPADGEYRMVVECSGSGVGRHPGRFATTIVVSGDTWRAGDSAAPTGAGPLWITAAGVLVAGAAALLLVLRVRRSRAARAARTAGPAARVAAGSRAS